MTAIIILNWNGADDTLACLNSLARAEGNFRVYIVDNGSTDNSVQRIGTWLDEHATFNGCLIPLDKNYGFACGNNKGIAIARKDNPSNYMLLNNDTEVKPDFLTALLRFSAANPRYRVLTPQINYFYDKRKVWNCGGKLSLGFRKYYYANQPDSAIRKKEAIPISFVTGCALFFYPELLNSQGHLLTERFFFGEEDFEFSMRMDKKRIRMACVLDSLIYHKVGASSDKMQRSGKVYLHYLNRFIDIRLHKSTLFYVWWAMMNTPLCLFHLYKQCRSISCALKQMRQLLNEAKRKDKVTREDFESLVIRNDYFKAL